MALRNVAQAVSKAAARVKKEEEKRQQAQSPQKKPTYYTKKAGAARAVAQAVGRQAAKPVYKSSKAKQKPTKRWGVDFGRYWAQAQKSDRAELGTNEYLIKDRSPKEQMKTDLASGSNYRMRNWISGRAKARQEDRGSTLEQAARLAALYGAVDPITKGFTREQAGDIHKQIQNAPSNLQDLYIKYGRRLSPVVDLSAGDEVVEPGTAYYNPATGRVYGDPDEFAFDSSQNNPYQALWHEYAHNLDWLSGGEGNGIGPSYSRLYHNSGTGNTLDETVRNDIDASLRDYWAKVRMNESPYDPQKALSSFNLDFTEATPYTKRNTQSLSDMMSPYSLAHGGGAGPLGWGHTKEYWDSSRGKESSEAFANLASASVAGGNPLRYVQAVLPNSYDAYLDMLSRMLAR